MVIVTRRPESNGPAAEYLNGAGEYAVGQPERFMTEASRSIEEVSVREWGPRKAIAIVGKSNQLAEILAKVHKISAFEEPVLITGESGVGKESLAQAVYLLSPRRGRPFVTVNCPQFQDGNLTVSELFGHTKGSFTGAIADRKGCFEAANGGVIFLDEIGDLAMSAQVMLLRALASGEFCPLGSTTPRSVSVRVIAATNRTVEELRWREQFRNDLYFRLCYFRIAVPPLRERGDDWLLLIDYYLEKLRSQYGIARRFSEESLAILGHHTWPGNVRELASIVTMGYAMADGDTIEPDHFLRELERRRESRSTTVVDELLRSMTHGGKDFWSVVHEPFMDRELNRTQVTAVIRRGLLTTRGNYRRLLDHFHLPRSDYQRFMDFLRHHRLKPPA